MAITAITIENFKGIRQSVRVELKPITLLFGPNSAGKSTIVQALHYAREIFERENLNPNKTILGGNAMDLGGFESLVHCHDTTLPISLGFELDLSNEDLPTYLENMMDKDFILDVNELWEAVGRVNSAYVKITVKWDGFKEKPFIWLYEVQLNNEPFVIIENDVTGIGQLTIIETNPFHSIFLNGISSEKAKKQFSAMRMDESNAQPDSVEDFGFLFPFLNSLLAVNGDGQPFQMQPIGLQGQKSALPTWGRKLDIGMNFLEQEEIEYDQQVLFEQTMSSLVVGPGELVNDFLEKFIYLGPLREIPPRNFATERSPDSSRWVHGLAAWDLLSQADETFLTRVNHWLTNEDRLQTGYSLELKKYKELDLGSSLTLSILQGKQLDTEVDFKKELLNIPTKKRLLLRVEENNIEVLPHDVGVGISQVLPVIVAALVAKSGIVAIEQPELHIHPAFQVALGDLFIEEIRQHPDLNFIIETHSEHLMLRFLRRIRETGENEAPDHRTLTPTELSIYFIEQGEAGISCSSIRVDEDGDFIDRWPKGFFNERVKERY